MTALDKFLADVKARAAAAEPRRMFRVAYPPSNYSGDEWDLLRGSTQDFETKDEAVAFAESKKNKRVPDWGQPRIWPVVIGHELPFRTDVERLVAMVECARKRLTEIYGVGDGDCENSRAGKALAELDRLVTGPEHELDSFVEAVKKSPLSNPENI